MYRAKRRDAEGKTGPWAPPVTGTIPGSCVSVAPDGRPGGGRSTRRTGRHRQMWTGRAGHSGSRGNGCDEARYHGTSPWHSVQGGRRRGSTGAGLLFRNKSSPPPPRPAQPAGPSDEAGQPQGTEAFVTGRDLDDCVEHGRFGPPNESFAHSVRRLAGAPGTRRWRGAALASPPCLQEASGLVRRTGRRHPDRLHEVCRVDVLVSAPPSDGRCFRDIAAGRAARVVRNRCGCALISFLT